MTSYRLPLGLALLLTLNACAMVPTPGTSPPTLTPPSTAIPTTTSATSADLVCSQMQVVQLSRNDTDGTKEQVQANNHVLAALCGKNTP